MDSSSECDPGFRRESNDVGRGGEKSKRSSGSSKFGNVGGSLPCDGVFSYVFSHAQMAAEGFVPGTTLYAQYWHRDSGFSAPNNFGLTNGVSIPILP